MNIAILKIGGITKGGGIIRLLLLIFIFGQSSFAQTDNNWTFIGEAGLNFSTNPAKVIRSSTERSPIAATISDDSGQLMFYFDGFTLRNNQHSTLKNSDSILCNVRSKNAFKNFIRVSFFLKSTLKADLYYLIYLSDTTTYFTGFQPSLLYLKIEKLNGEFTVTEKNRHILDFFYYTYDFELRRLNDTQVDIIHRRQPFLQSVSGIKEFSDSVIIYSLQETSGSEIALNSKRVQTGTLASFKNYWISSSELKISPNGKMLLEAVSTLNYSQSDPRNYVWINLHTLDADSRIIDSEIIYSIENEGQNGLTSLDFSSNSEYVFILHENYTNNSNGKDTIFRFNINSEIIESIGTVVNAGYTSKLAPDGKIYYFEKAGNPVNGRAFYCLENINRPIDEVKLIDLFDTDLIPVSGVHLTIPFTFPELGYADFYSISPICADSSIFRNVSSDDFTSYLWIFEEDSIWKSDRVDVTYKFKKSGSHLVRLYAFKGNKGYKFYSQFVDVILPVKAHYQTSSKEGCQYIRFDYYDSSQYDTVNQNTGLRWHWSSAELDTVITSFNPKEAQVSHVYEQNGLFTMKLTFSNGFCTNTFDAKNAIVILPAPQPGIKLSDTEGCQPFLFSAYRKFSDDVDSVQYSVIGESKTSLGLPVSFVLNHPNSYQIVQRLYGPTGCITNDTAEIIVHQGFSPFDTVRMVQVDVSTSGHLISWLSQPVASAFQVECFKNGTWQIEGIVPDTFYNVHVNSQREASLYRVAGIDSCQNLRYSKPMKSIFLTGTSVKNEYSILSWNHPNAINENRIFTLISNSPGSVTSIYDGLDTLFNDNGFFSEEIPQRYYSVESFTDGNTDWPCRSNLVAIPYYPIVFIPNSFSPNGDGLNDNFTPKIYGFVEGTYVFRIYNRWGALVFESNDPAINWDGNTSGKPAIQGVYFYTLHVVLKEKDANGQQIINKTGSINLLY